MKTGAMVNFCRFENCGFWGSLTDFVVSTNIFLEVIGLYKNVNQEFYLDSKIFYETLITGLGLIANNNALLLFRWESEKFPDIRKKQKVNCVYNGGNKVP